MSIKIIPLIKKVLPHRRATKGLLAWSAGQRVLAVLPVLALLWLVQNLRQDQHQIHAINS